MWKEGEFSCYNLKPILGNSYFRLLFSKSDSNKLYPVLFRKDKFEMTITEYLIEVYKKLLSSAKQDILILGLGLGLCDLIVDSPTYIEKHQEIINNVKVKGKVIHGDACTIQLDQKFDFVLNDITGYDHNCNFNKFLKPEGKLVKFSLF